MPEKYTQIHQISTQNLALARCLSALGVQYREEDPVTKIVETRNGVPHEICTFWFVESQDFNAPDIYQLIEAFHKFSSQGIKILRDEHPIYWMIACIKNGSVYLDWIKKATPFVRKTTGKQTLLVPLNPSSELQRVLKNHGLA